MPAAKNIGLHQTGEKVLDASNGDELVLEVRGGAITQQMMPLSTVRTIEGGI